VSHIIKRVLLVEYWGPGNGEFLGFGKGGDGKRVERKPITGVWGRAPVGQGIRAKPTEAGTLAFGRSMEAANLAFFFLKFGNADNRIYLCCFANGEALHHAFPKYAIQPRKYTIKTIYITHIGLKPYAEYSGYFLSIMSKKLF